MPEPTTAELVEQVRDFPRQVVRYYKREITFEQYVAEREKYDAALVTISERIEAAERERDEALRSCHDAEEVGDELRRRVQELGRQLRAEAQSAAVQAQRVQELERKLATERKRAISAETRLIHASRP